jgi:hypothetical protein
VLCHAGIVYESSGVGAYFWIVDDPATNDLSGLVNLVLDIVMMPLLFLVSGYFAPASLARRSGWGFLRARFTRLILPWLIAVVTLIPLHKMLFLYSRGLPQEHWTSYFHVSNGIFSQSWLWFLPILFAFNVLYLLLTKLPIRVPNFSLRAGLCAALPIGLAYSVAVHLLGLTGWTKTYLFDFQNERLGIYFLVFLLGVLCFRRRVFDGPPRRLWLYLLVNAIAWVPVTAYIALLLHGWLHPGEVLLSRTADSLLLWSSFHLSLLSLVYLTVETFRRYARGQGRLRREMSRNSYYVYIIHTIVLGLIAVLMLNLAIPSLLKYAILTVATFVTCHTIVYSLRRLSSSVVRQQG